MKVSECTPFSATRRTSAAANPGFQIAGIAIGMNRPGFEAHHSSMCQSLYAWTRASENSSSSVANRRAAKPGNDGKFMVASTPPAFMSLTRSFGS